MCTSCGLNLVFGDASIKIETHLCTYDGDCGGGMTVKETYEQVSKWHVEQGLHWHTAASFEAEVDRKVPVG